MTKSCLQTILGKCRHLEVLEGFGHLLLVPNACNLIVNNFPNLRAIQFTTFTSAANGSTSSHINILKKLNHLQTIIMTTPPPVNILLPQEQRARTKDEWIELAKRILIHIQLRDNLEKTIVVRDYDGNERRILLKPKPLFEDEA